ncbi:hypothetical protein FUA23_01755 [Neolewinella aurantiaca]|uniref:Tetratricopeptide repeat protein n=1 Tax=Neolewinella aurantiaca TaxID=2602767 RepID=A0A5C7FMT5_9BACT|nr:hypothetical protein [Neolewinella aurantiaca]TXF91444.1 hypothetical protein FUA23_01755 [Neolewinella aurantiaca]
MRYLQIILLLAFTTSLQADALSSRLRLLLPGDDAPTVNERQFLYQRVSLLFDVLENDKVGRKSIKKRIKKISSRLEDDYLRVYAPDARLADAFLTGRYNDATAALLTALAFEEFDVEYEGYVDHWEAYLVADPDRVNTVVYQPGHQKHKDNAELAFRRNYLELLRATLLADLPNMSNKEVDELFERYYYKPEKKLSFGQLTAFMQFRRAQAAYSAKDYTLAVELLENALSKEDRPAFLVLRKAAELQIKAINRPEVEGDIPTLFQQWSEAPDNKYLPAALLQHFDEQQRLLIAEGRIGEAADLLADYLNRAPAGKITWAGEMSRLQKYRLLSHHFLNGNISEARRIAENLYAEDPENETVKYLLGEIVIDQLRRSRATGRAFSSAVETAATDFPFIRRQDRFADLLLRELAWKVRDVFAEENGPGGEDALRTFRNSLVDIPINESRKIWTLTAFIAASNYYFRAEDYARARFYVEEGLKYNAGDEYLLHRRELLARY